MFRIGCQTYTWEMLGKTWHQRTDELLAAIAGAGYRGIEITDTMIGDYAGRPEAFGAALSSHGLELVAFTCSSTSGFTVADKLADDLRMIDAALEFTGHFPGAMMVLGSATRVSEGDEVRSFEVAAEIYNAAGARGQELGVMVAFHPSSHHNTLLGRRADYDRIMSMTDPSLVGWVPDTGHILRGNMDLIDTLSSYLDRIRYLHLKDVDSHGKWRMLGEGDCDIRAVVELIRTAPGCSGWLVLEEESDFAAADPAFAVAQNRRTLQALVVE